MTIFRCPFEVKGEEAGLVLAVRLSEVRVENIKLVSEGFRTFHARPELIALRCCLPATLRDACTSIEELKWKILPIQADILAAEIEWRFYPFLWHQI